MGATVTVLNRRNRLHRGRSSDERASKRAHFRNLPTGKGVSIAPGHQSWLQQLNVSMLLRKWRMGE